MKLPQARTEKLTVRELSEETLVYDLLRHKSHCLNRTAALVWQHCNGQMTVAEMAAILHKELDLPADPHIVRLALEQLGRRNLLKEAVAPLSTKARMTRRDALKKIAVTAAALPIVMTLTAKTASANNSCTETECQVCLGRFPVPADSGKPCSGGTCDGKGNCVKQSTCLPAGAALSGCNGNKNSQCCSGNCVSTGQTDTCS